MEFKLTRSQTEIQKAARRFAKTEFAREGIRDPAMEGAFPWGLLQKAAELGFTSIHFDERYLGGGLGLLEHVLMAEELCRRDSTLGAALMLSTYGADALHDFGSDELKTRFLADVSQGKILVGASIIEYGRGDYTAPVQVEAYPEGDQWLINGTVSSLVNCGTSGIFIIPCQTSSESSVPESISLFLVESDRKGVRISETGPNVGLQLTPLADLQLDHVRVPQNNTLGAIGAGWDLLSAFTIKSRLLLAALALGTARGALERTISYVKQRRQFGRRIAEFPVTRDKLARMALAVNQAQCLTYRAAWQSDQGEPDATHAAMAKLTATQAALDCSHEAIQLHGGYGFSKEYEVERFCRDAKMLHLLGGHPQTLTDQIANSVIGKVS